MNTQEATNNDKEPDLNDVGTRFEHLKDYAEALAACADIIEKRGIFSVADKERHVKFKIAAELAQHTIDNFAGYSDVRTEYRLYQLLNGIPQTGDAIEGGRGTPLAHDYRPSNNQSPAHSE